MDTVVKGQGWREVEEEGAKSRPGDDHDHFQ